MIRSVQVKLASLITPLIGRPQEHQLFPCLSFTVCADEICRLALYQCRGVNDMCRCQRYTRLEIQLSPHAALFLSLQIKTRTVFRPPLSPMYPKNITLSSVLTRNLLNPALVFLSFYCSFCRDAIGGL